MILNLHDLQSCWSIPRIIHETLLKQSIHQRIIDLFISNSHILNEIFGLLGLATIEWILLDYKVVETAAQGPDVNCWRHRVTGKVVELTRLRDQFWR